jgi:hypothetical protein
MATSGSTAAQLLGLGTIRLVDLVSQLLEEPPEAEPHARLVVHYEDSALHDRWIPWRPAPGSGLPHARQLHDHGCTSVLAIAGTEPTRVLFDDPVGDRQPQPRPATPAREERLEDPREVIETKPGTLVEHRASDPLPLLLPESCHLDPHDPPRENAGWHSPTGVQNLQQPAMITMAAYGPGFVC